MIISQKNESKKLSYNEDGVSIVIDTWQLNDIRATDQMRQVK